MLSQAHKKTDEDFAAYLDEVDAKDRGETNTSQQTTKISQPETLSDENVPSETPDVNAENEGGQAAANNPTEYVYRFTSTDALLDSDEEDRSRQQQIIADKQSEVQEESLNRAKLNVKRALAGNFIIAVAKLAAAISSGSSAMMSEFVHSVVDCGNQSLLLIGLRDSGNQPDRRHPYGYGKSIYFWALVSALGTFFLGAGVSGTYAVGELFNPSVCIEPTWEVWGVLVMSFVVDGYVLSKTVQGVLETMPTATASEPGLSFWKYTTTKLRDPATLAVLMEDGAACLGIVLAMGGIGLTHYTGMPVFDALAGVTISGLLAAMGLALVKVNHRFLIGQGLDKAVTEDIEKILLNRRSIDNVYSVQSQWTGPDTFSYKAEVDFDGTFLAAKLLPRYQNEFLNAKDTLDRDLRVLMSWYAEDVMRAAEREVRHIEDEIRKKYPMAQYIELEPMSKDADRYAIDDGMEAQLRKVEIEALNRYLRSLYKIKERSVVPGGVSKHKEDAVTGLKDLSPFKAMSPVATNATDSENGDERGHGKK